MHNRHVVAEALRLHEEEGLGARRVARQLGLPVTTVRDWHAGKLPRHSCGSARETGTPRCSECLGPAHRFSQLGSAYVHLLGLYLGDGTISLHARGVHRLRVFLDARYPQIVNECVQAMQVTLPENRVHTRLTPSNCYVVSAYSCSWPCLFPQHGPGPKHARSIYLSDWQQTLAKRWPEHLLKGLIQSDGCRSYSTGAGGWKQPRYVFTNVSTDVTSIFCSACDCLRLRWTASFPKRESDAVSIYISRKTDVARLDEFIGPKR